jgi:hypothetical protein
MSLYVYLHETSLYCIWNWFPSKMFQMRLVPLVSFFNTLCHVNFWFIYVSISVRNVKLIYMMSHGDFCLFILDQYLLMVSSCVIQCTYAFSIVFLNVFFCRCCISFSVIILFQSCILGYIDTIWVCYFTKVFQRVHILWCILCRWAFATSFAIIFMSVFKFCHMVWGLKSLECDRLFSILVCVCIPSSITLFIDVVSESRLAGQDHHPFPMWGRSEGANLMETIWWSVGIWLISKFQSIRLLECLSDGYILSRRDSIWWLLLKINKCRCGCSNLSGLLGHWLRFHCPVLLERSPWGLR